MAEVGILRKGETSAEQILRQILDKVKDGRAGAVAFFVGVVKGLTGRGKPVKGLSYEAYEELALKSLKQIRDETLAKPGIVETLIFHVVDELGVGEEIMYVAVAGWGRKEVFQALAEVVDRVKREVPIFKKEILVDGRSYWVAEEEAKRKYESGGEA